MQYPFSTDIEEGGIPPDGSQEILVDFDPGYKARCEGTGHDKNSLYVLLSLLQVCLYDLSIGSR